MLIAPKLDAGLDVGYGTIDSSEGEECEVERPPLTAGRHGDMGGMRTCVRNEGRGSRIGEALMNAVSVAPWARAASPDPILPERFCTAQRRLATAEGPACQTMLAAGTAEVAIRSCGLPSAVRLIPVLGRLFDLAAAQVAPQEEQC